MKSKVSNYLDFWAPVAIGAGVAFTIIFSRYGSLDWSTWLGLIISIVMIIVGVIYAPQKSSLIPWSRALTAFGFIYLLFYLPANNWMQVLAGAIAIVLGFLLTPARR